MYGLWQKRNITKMKLYNTNKLFKTKNHVATIPRGYSFLSIRIFYRLI
jgi:hypothetical protein